MSVQRYVYLRREGEKVFGVQFVLHPGRCVERISDFFVAVYRCRASSLSGEDALVRVSA